MPDTVIIEFIGDTAKLEQAYQKIESSQSEVAAAFKKTNADMQSATGDSAAEVEKLSGNFRSLSSTIKAGVLKPLLDELLQAGKSSTALHTQLKQLTGALTQMRTEGNAGSRDLMRIQNEALKFAQDTSNKILAIKDQARNARYNAEIRKLQQQSRFELDNNNLTAAQKLAIQKKYQKEEAALKLQQWKAEQKSKETQAVINTALAVVNALATAPWPVDIAMAAAAAATGAAQIAVIAGQKPPQFAKGTPTGAAGTPAGFKLVGEKGPEFIYTPGGERVIDAPDTAALLNKWGIPSYSTPMPSADTETVKHTATGSTRQVIDEDSLAKKIAVEMSKAAKPVFHWDRNGFTTHLVSMGGKKTIVNNKYSA